MSEEPKRYLADCSIEVERDALASARALLGAGYVDEYYASAASEFMWLYRAGYKDAVLDARDRSKRRARKAKR